MSGGNLSASPGASSRKAMTRNAITSLRRCYADLRVIGCAFLILWATVDSQVLQWVSSRAAFSSTQNLPSSQVDDDDEFTLDFAAKPAQGRDGAKNDCPPHPNLALQTTKVGYTLVALLASKVAIPPLIFIFMSMQC